MAPTPRPSCANRAYVSGASADAHVPLGRQVLARGIIFLDLAVAQIAGLGIIVAHSLDWEPGGWQKRWPEIQEALIGSLFVLASSGSVLLLSADPHGGEQIRELLVGQILWADYSQLLYVAILYVAILTVWFSPAGRGSSVRFYLLFALAITASVQVVGVYLVFASLILPALAVRRLGRNGLLWGYGIGLAGYAVGLLLAALLDVPAGTVIVYVLALAAWCTGQWLSRTALR
ncbi:MAG TPA: metal ABC transporter permease [Gammaproteobacteria bacterium]|nr:metal ABC transporter permease [Gammaproteobacteria bacterium]